MIDEKLPQGEPVEIAQAHQIKLNTGWNNDTGLPMVLLAVGPTQIALPPDHARTLAVQIIGAALVAEQEVAKRNAPLLQQATAAAMGAINKSH
jgi:hypothetical protein